MPLKTGVSITEKMQISFKVKSCYENAIFCDKTRENVHFPANFGDSCSSLVIRIVQEKYLSQICQLKLIKHLIIHGRYADNYSEFLNQESYNSK